MRGVHRDERAPGKRSKPIPAPGPFLKGYGRRSGQGASRVRSISNTRPLTAPRHTAASVESRMGAVAWAMRQRSVSHPHSVMIRAFGAHCRVEMWRGGCRSNISVAASFVWRCLTGSTLTPFPHPSHRTGHADFPHPALGQDFTPSPTARRAQAGTGVRARSARKGARVDKLRPCVA